jgi:cytochrome c peroxidase
LPALPGRAVNQDAIRLGKRLFVDTRLSADGKVSCGKCHIAEHALTDGRARSSGHNGRLGTRNAPSLLNVAYLDSLFWDGRGANLESQALMPLTNPVEHALPSNTAVADLIRRDPKYTRDFSRAFGVRPEQISSEMVGRALAAYERTLIAGGSPFDRFLYGGDRAALSAGAVRGLELFRGRAQCASCHLIGQSSALLTDGQFHIAPAGLPRTVTDNLPALANKVIRAADATNRAELEGLIATDVDVAALGRFIVTRKPADIGKFKTPSLRNVALTAPYMHDGSVKTLAEAVDLELYSRGAGLSYPIALTVSERQDLSEFLQALTSPYALRGAVNPAAGTPPPR